MIVRVIKKDDLDEVEDFDDLYSEFEVLARKHGEPWKFEDIRTRVAVDFASIKSDVAGGNFGNNKVYVQSKERGVIVWIDANPNEMIRDAIREREKAQSGSVSNHSSPTGANDVTEAND